MNKASIKEISATGHVEGGRYSSVEFLFDDPTFSGTVDGVDIDPSIIQTLGPFTATAKGKIVEIQYTVSAGTFKLVLTT